MLRCAPHLPDALVGLAPVRDGPLDLALEDGPQALVEPLDRTGVDGHRVEHRAPDVVLALAVGAVADADRAGALVAAEVVERLLVEVAAAVGPVHDLQLVVALGDVGDEPEEVVGLPVEPERVQRPEREHRSRGSRCSGSPSSARRPGVSGSDGGGRGQERARGRVGQALQRERAALQVRAPRVVREPATGQPVLPVVGGPGEPGVGLLVVRRRVVLGPREGAEAEVALLEQRAGHRLAALEPDAHVAGEGELQPGVAGLGPALVVGGAGVVPARGLPAVVEHRLALELDLHLAVHAAHRAQQDVVGVVVGGGPLVGVGQLVLVVPRPDEQEVAHDDPPGRGAPARLEDHGARQVAAGRRRRHVGGREAEPAGVPVEQRAEHARTVSRREAEPLDVAAGGDQCHRLAVREEGVVGDRRERRTPTSPPF